MDRPYKMGGSRRSRCAWSDSAAEVDIAFHDGAATHLQITSAPPSEDGDVEESCALAKRVAQVAISRISR
ncbi:hypothetical protein AB0N89_06710 [Amycolatopsis sp. NPDC089917]|uniref:hypothetical protein n=1 Tax=Amycolatopsis sp. NPDC089917 TaxID=3155187 RepID=UPI0034416E56